MRIKYWTTVILLLIWSVVLSAGPVTKKITLIGERLPDEIALANRPETPFVVDSLIADSIRLTEYFQNQGWFDCQIKINIVERSGGMNIVYEPLKGKQYKLRLNPIFTAGQDSIHREIAAIVSRYESQLANTENIESLANDLLEIYADNGYPYCEVKPKDFQKLPDGILEITVNINPGPKVDIAKIEFPGRKNLEQRFLQTYISMDIPGEYSNQNLESARLRLAHAGFLKEAGQPQLRYINAPEKGIIYFPIKEVSPFVIDGAFGYSSKDKSLYGQINAALTNILGKGRQFTINWAKKDKASRKLRLAYSEPFAFNRPIRMDLSAYQDNRDSLYIETGGQVGVSYVGSIALDYGVFVGASRIAPEPYGRNLLPSKNRIWLSVSFSADTRDNRINPRKGDYLRLEANFVNEKAREDSLFPGSVKDFRTARLDYQKSFPIGRRQSLYAGFFGRGDFSANSSIDRQFPLGGFGSLRGYRQDIFYVIRAALFSFEYRFLTGKEGRAYIFTDMATFQKGLTSGNKSELKAGFGIGISAPVRGGIALIEFAAPSDEGLSALKLHFGIKAGF